MSVIYKKICRKCRPVLIFLLFLPNPFLASINAQTSNGKWEAVTKYLEGNIADFGGRAVLMVSKDGKIVYSQSVNELSQRQKRVQQFLAKRKGSGGVDATEDFAENTKQPIASCSKWLSAALVMTFVDEGKLSINDTIGKFLPVMSANGKGNITIWQCLSHLTGIKQIGVEATLKGTAEDGEAASGGNGNLRDRLRARKEGGSGSINQMSPYKTMAEAMDSIAAQPMEGEPGKTFHYGNAGLQIAAAIVEKLGGKDFETLFTERIAQPCNMIATDFGHKPVPLAAGGAWSTPTDYLHFLEMILANGKYNGKQVLSAPSVAAMQFNRAAGAEVVYSPTEAGDFGYGFGEWTMGNAAERSKAVTSPGLFGSFPWVDNDKKYCAFLFSVNLKSKGRHERYMELKKLVDAALSKE